MVTGQMPGDGDGDGDIALEDRRSPQAYPSDHAPGLIRVAPQQASVKLISSAQVTQCLSPPSGPGRAPRSRR